MSSPFFCIRVNMRLNVVAMHILCYHKICPDVQAYYIQVYHVHYKQRFVSVRVIEHKDPNLNNDES